MNHPQNTPLSVSAQLSQLKRACFAFACFPLRQASLLGVLAGATRRHLGWPSSPRGSGRLDKFCWKEGGMGLEVQLSPINVKLT